LNREFAGEGYPEVKMGIAIHYGDVISGNLGSVNRMDYTVIGDTVNIASRIEELAGPGQILVSEELLEPIRNFVRSRFVGEERLRGRSASVRIYELEAFHDEEVFALLKAREPWRVNHFLQVSSLNTAMGMQLGYGNAELEEFKLATLLLDIGRAKLDPQDLAADRPFTEAELQEVRGIPVLNRRFADSLGGFSERVLDLMLHFHENYDGSGYPDGMQGRAIPEWARICRISDSWVAMTTPRPYRKVLEGEAAREELLRHSGSHFDPALAVLFFEMLAARPGPG
jgi:HD-GYP domain-containing protein (c-di-GMP phosphodiesterase class II)